MKKNFSMHLTVFCILALALVLSACSPAEPTVSPEFILTSVAQTVEADFAKTAMARPTETATPIPTPIPTLVPPTPTIPVSVTGAVPTSAATALPGGVDKGVWVASEPPDDNRVTPGQKFDLTITLMNTGTSTWTTSYGISFASGEQMGAPNLVNFNYQIPPSMSGQVILKLTMPTTAGAARGDWNIVNPSGAVIGNFFIQYQVVSP